MRRYLQKKYALSNEGVKDLQKSIIYNALLNIGYMIPVGIFILMIQEVTEENKTLSPIVPSMGKYILLSLIAVGILYLLQYMQYSISYLSTYQESKKIRIDLAEKLRKLPLSYFGKKNLSDLTNTLMGDCTNIEHAFSHAIPQFYGAILSTIIIIINLLIMDWRMGIATLWVVPVAFFMIFASKKKQKNLKEDHYWAKRDCADKIQEGLENIYDIQTFNMEEEYLNKLDKTLDISERTQIKSELTMSSFLTGAQAILRLGFATVIVTGGNLLIKGEITFITYCIFLITVSRLYDPLSTILANIAEIFGADIPINRVKEMNSQKTQTGNTEYNLENYDLTFNHVGFSYEKGESVLKDISFTAKQGEVTALVGPSGGGKSTVSKLMARFWEPDCGNITLGQIDIKTIDPEALLKNYSIVFQDVVLFNDTVMENIRIGKKNASDKQVLYAAKLARCDEFIKKMPKGYETIIGENGSKLSGGEKQRISIARAILKDAPIILLDEATASLDVDNESEIQCALSELIKDKTVIVIAHRLRTVEAADKIIVLKDGRVEEQGTHAILMKNKGTYYDFYTLQKESDGMLIKR